jgi:predicted aldo/keto reductase-like oxidoreductase
MQYRKLGPIDWAASILGYGCMRLPTTGEGVFVPELKGTFSVIDEERSIEMLSYAIEHGVNYLDTGYPYHGGACEPFIGRFLDEFGYRDRVRVATKLPVWLVERYEDFDRLLDIQLERLQADHVDIYLLHGLRRAWWRRVRDLGVLRWAEGARADGRIRHLGFSFHDTADVLEEIVEAYDGCELCQIQYNFIDVGEQRDLQAGVKGLKLAASRGLAIVVMEPLRGGRLATAPPPVEALWDTAAVKRTPAEWALRWVWNHPEVSVVLSGMTKLAEVKENLATAEAAAPDSMTREELVLVSRVREAYRSLCPIPCTMCYYCMPCPNGVNIPGNFALYNMSKMYDTLEAERSAYARILGHEQDAQASRCVQCGRCEEICPQHIEIISWLAHVHQVLGEGAPDCGPD